ncbi:hypothetical protein AAVH_31313 [Aphelenchoides avenae]|nr:hypothetical protein AAVH_31313 [Aphelenchus avenae]
MATSAPSASAVPLFALNGQALIPLFYAIPSLLIYTATILVLLTHFREPFYRLFALNGIMDCLSWLSYYFTSRASRAPIFVPLYSSIPNEGVITGVWYFLHGYFHIVQFISAFFVAVNRFSVLLFPVSYDRTWTRILPTITVVTTALPALLSAFIAFEGGRWELEGSAYAMHGMSKTAERRMNLVTILFCSVYFVGCTTMNVAVGIVYYVFDSKKILSPMTDFLLANLQLFMLDLHLCTAPLFLIAMSLPVRQEMGRIYAYWGSPKLDMVNTMRVTSR